MQKQSKEITKELQETLRKLDKQESFMGEFAQQHAFVLLEELKDKVQAEKEQYLDDFYKWLVNERSKTSYVFGDIEEEDLVEQFKNDSV